jgi:protein-disulfide isomerase
MMIFNVRACLMRVTMLLLAAVLTAVQAAVFLDAALQREQGPGAQGRLLRPTSPRLSAWTYGASAARFTLIEYADLECTYCASSFPYLRRWIDEHHDVNWQWRHLPLSVHEPRAMQTARIAECIGQSQGNDAFWKAVAEHYRRLEEAARPTDPQAVESPALRMCLRSTRPDAVIRAHLEEARMSNIHSTPTLIFQDRQSGRHVRLEGAPSEDVLLSAIDALLAG